MDFRVPTAPNIDMFPRKRKHIDDFFTPKPKVSRLSSLRDDGESHLSPVRLSFSRALTSAKAAVPGLEIVEDFITAKEERNLLSFLYSTKCRWRTDLSRRCMHFGGTYCLYTPPDRLKQSQSPASMSRSKEIEQTVSEPEIHQAPPMPNELTWLLDRFSSSGIFDEGQRPQYCIVNEYISSQGISPHVENFQFGEPVVGLSLLCPVNIRFRELVTADGGSVRSGKAALAAKTGRRADVLLKGRSICVMRGDSRWKWQHEIVRSCKGRGVGWKRVSLTFRWKE